MINIYLSANEGPPRSLIRGPWSSWPRNERHLQHDEGRMACSPTYYYSDCISLQLEAGKGVFLGGVDLDCLVPKHHWMTPLLSINTLETDEDDS